jgi:exosortase/archaeosortase family protein
LLTIPFSILKNAIRIVTLTVLATRVDPGFLSGKLHQEGGFVFFLITLALFYPIWKTLRKSETASYAPIGTTPEAAISRAVPGS